MGNGLQMTNTMRNFDAVISQPDPEDEDMLRDLLATGELMVGACWWESDWPEAARDLITVAVVCNDVFGAASADAETLPMSELKAAWTMHKANPTFGLTAWCVSRRKMAPWAGYRPILERAGYDIDVLIGEPKRIGSDIDPFRTPLDDPQMQQAIREIESIWDRN